MAFTATQIPFINDRMYPAELAGPHYPSGIPIHDESELTRPDHDARGRRRRVRLLRRLARVRDAQGAAQVIAAGANFAAPRARTRPCSRPTCPVVAVCAVRTGAGKSQTTRAIAGMLKDAGKRVVAVRHPMPYGDLVAQRVQRFATVEDLDRYEMHDRGARGVRAAHRVRHDHLRRRRLRATSCAQAQKECDVLLWDGGNNDLPFYRPTCEHRRRRPAPRRGTRRRTIPGEANLRMADVIVINKMDSADARAARRRWTPRSARVEPGGDRRAGEQPRHRRRRRRDRAASASWWSRTARRSRTAR